MLPCFSSQMPLVEEQEIQEVQPLQFQQKSLPATVPTEFVEPMVAGSMLAEVEQELATLLEETTPQKEQVKQLCSCRSVESLSSSYHASSDAYSSSSDNGEDIESNTEEVPIENEEEAVSKLESAPVFAAPERPRSCPPMGISQKYSIREIRDPRLQAVRRWAQQSEALAIAEEPSTSSDSESHSEEGDYDYDLERSPPLSPISSANDSEGEWAVESLDKMPTLIGGVIETAEVSKDELAMLPPPLESQEIQVQSVSTEWPTTTEASKETISTEDIANYNPFMTSFIMMEELPLVAPVEIEIQKAEITLPEAIKEIEVEKVEITIPEAIQEIETKAVIISIAEAVQVAHVQRKKTQKRKLPMKQRLRNAKRAGKN